MTSQEDLNDVTCRLAVRTRGEVELFSAPQTVWGLRTCDATSRSPLASVDCPPVTRIHWLLKGSSINDVIKAFLDSFLCHSIMKYRPMSKGWCKILLSPSRETYFIYHKFWSVVQSKPEIFFESKDWVPLNLSILNRTSNRTFIFYFCDTKKYIWGLGRYFFLFCM